MYKVEFIKFEDGQLDAVVVHRLPQDFQNFGDALEAGALNQ